MADVVICSGFSDYTAENSFAIESPFLLFKDHVFCDTIGLYRLFVDEQVNLAVTDIDAPPYVCYVLKQILHDKGFSSEMVFYLDLEKERRERILKGDCHIIFLSTTLIPSKDKLKKAASEIRRLAPDSIIVCGGALVDQSYRILRKYQEKSKFYDSCKQDFLFLEPEQDKDIGIDLYIFNDPQLTVAGQVVRHVKNGLPIQQFVHELPNAAIHMGQKWHFTRNEPLASPSFMQSIDWKIFSDDEMRLSAPMATSKGCPNKCSFCSFQSISQHTEKNHEALLAEIESLREAHGDKIRHISFCDDNICGSRQSLSNLLTFLNKHSMPFRWSSFLDARYIDGNIAKMLYSSNCSYVKIGMESASDIVLQNMRKPCRTRHYQQAVNALSRYGISIDSYFIVGFPGETKQTIEASIEAINSCWAPDLSVNQFTFFPFVLAPLSPIFEEKERIRFGIEGYYFNWKHSTMNSEEAAAAIPEIVCQISTMQPHHGNAEKILVEEKSILAQIDRTRGELVRQRLKSGKEDQSLWAKLKDLVTVLRLEKNSQGMPIKFL